MLRQICIPDEIRFNGTGKGFDLLINGKSNNTVEIRTNDFEHRTLPTYTHTANFGFGLDADLKLLLLKMIKYDVEYNFYSMFYSLSHMYSHFDSYDNNVFHVYNSNTSTLYFESEEDLKKWYDFKINGDSKFMKISHDNIQLLYKSKSNITMFITNGLLPIEMEKQFIADLLVGEKENDN